MTKRSVDLVSYRLDRANETLGEAQLLAGAGRWNACVNRLYYACFYAVTALLIKDDLASPRHTGVRGLFNKHYVKTGKVPRELAGIYNHLFERRQEGDYIDFVYFKETDVIPWISGAEKFIAHIEDLARQESA